MHQRNNQAIFFIWTSAGIVSIVTLGINFSEILIENNTFLFKKMHLKMSSAKWRLFHLGLKVMIRCPTHLPQHKIFDWLHALHIRYPRVLV